MSDLLLSARNDKVKELLICDHRLVIIGHEVHKESALLLRNLTLKHPWLQIIGEKHEEGAVHNAIVILSTLAQISRVLLNCAIHGQLPGALCEKLLTVHDLLIELVGREIWQLEQNFPDDLSLRKNVKLVSVIGRRSSYTFLALAYDRQQVSCELNQHKIRDFR